MFIIKGQLHLDKSKGFYLGLGCKDEYSQIEYDVIKVDNEHAYIKKQDNLIYKYFLTKQDKQLLAKYPQFIKEIKKC